MPNLYLFPVVSRIDRFSSVLFFYILFSFIAWDDFFLAEDKGEIKDRKQQERINLSSRLLDEFINSIVD